MKIKTSRSHLTGWDLYKKGRSQLKKSYVVSVVKALSHGLTHFLLFLSIIAAVAILWPQYTDGEKVDIRDLSIHMENNGYDTLTSLSILLHLDSDQIKNETDGKYKDKLTIKFGYDIKNPEKKDTTKIHIYNYPPLNDIICYQDSITFSTFAKNVHIGKNTTESEYVHIPLAYKTYCKTKIETIDTVQYLYHFPYGNNLYIDTLQLKDSDSTTYNNCLLKDAKQKINDDSTTYRIYKIKERYKTGKILEKITTDIIPADNLALPGGRYIASTQYANYLSNNLGISDKNYYYNYHISLPYLPVAINTTRVTHLISNSVIEIKIGDFDNLWGNYHNINKDIMINNIYPTPDILQNGRILYFTEDKIDAVRDNGGIILYAEDINLKNKKQQNNLIKSIFTGTAIAIAFDIFIQLIKELRTLNKIRRKDDDDELNYDSNNDNDMTITLS